jgi:hypothetical protein
MAEDVVHDGLLLPREIQKIRHTTDFRLAPLTKALHTVSEGVRGPGQISCTNGRSYKYATTTPGNMGCMGPLVVTHQSSTRNRACRRLDMLSHGDAVHTLRIQRRFTHHLRPQHQSAGGQRMHVCTRSTTTPAHSLRQPVQQTAQVWVRRGGLKPHLSCAHEIAPSAHMHRTPRTVHSHSDRHNATKGKTAAASVVCLCRLNLGGFCAPYTPNVGAAPSAVHVLLLG